MWTLLYKTIHLELWILKKIMNEFTSTEELSGLLFDC